MADPNYFPKYPASITTVKEEGYQEFLIADVQTYPYKKKHYTILLDCFGQIVGFRWPLLSEAEIINELLTAAEVKS